MELEAIIGLEIHVQLKTKSKMFCRCNNMSDGAAPNTLLCPICTGHPGTLPVPNRQAVAFGIMAAQALGCSIPEHAKFDRKHYSYPDLPKGYQISQYDEPIGVHGKISVQVGDTVRDFGITRLHLEEDVGKLTHRGSDTFVDYNRAGTPLIEIVTEPDFRTPEEAKAFLQELRLTMQYLGVSDAEMEKGHLRCDANISLRPVGDTALYPKTEIKNLNSFRSVERALTFEISRQTELWNAGTPPAGSSTRGWDENAGETVAQRDKEVAADYRYFPEPDIPPLHFTPEFLAEVTAEMPELPSARRLRLVEQYGFTPTDAAQLVTDRMLVKFIEEVISELKEVLAEHHGKNWHESWLATKGEYAKLIANWTLNRLTRMLVDANKDLTDVRPALYAEFIELLKVGTLNSTTGQAVLRSFVETGYRPSEIIAKEGLGAVDDSALSEVIRSVIDAHPDQVEQYRQGKTAVLQFLVGQVMRATKGSADATNIRTLLEDMLK